MNLGGGSIQAPPVVQPKFSGIPGFATANFGQAWMQM